jgi:mutator protein MutT
MSKKKKIQVVTGCVISNNKILLNKRIEKELADIHEMWELPGGKIEPNETPEEAIIREIKEETGYITSVIDGVPFHFNIQRKANDYLLEITLNCFICELTHTEFIEPLFNIKVGEVKWIDVFELEFLQIIAGSREFIYWILKYQCKLELARLKNQEFGFIYFENIDEKNNHFKKYQITILFSPNASDESMLYCLSYHYGKIDKKEQTINKYFSNEFLLHKALLTRINDRINHGYYIVYFDNFPLKDWIEKHRQNIKASKYKQTKIDFTHG